jgi:hypothetical protein
MAATTRHVFRWDLDKTYLYSEFERMRDLIKSAFESARDKRAVPGAPALLRALRQGGGHRICIVSGSPEQMRRVLQAKLALDGVEYDEFVLKDNVRNLVRGRFRALRSQIPYKLPVLLRSRVAIAGAPPETLFGDDAEADAVVYSLYADLLDGRLADDELPRILAAARAYDDEIAETMALARRVQRTQAVRRILIHLDQRSPTARFTKFGRRLVPIYNYFQAALVLYGDQLLDSNQVLFVARDMLASEEYSLATLANSLQDLIRRGRLVDGAAQALCLELSEIAAGAAAPPDGQPTADEIAWAFAERIRNLGGAPPIEWPDRSPDLDYVKLVDQEYRRRHQ